MRPRNYAGHGRRVMLLLSLTSTLTLAVAVTLAVACSQDSSVNRLFSPNASPGLPERDPAEIKKPKELWVTSQDSSILFIRNFEDLAPIDQIRLPANAGPHIITFHTPDFAYVGGMTDGNVYVVDANARQVVQTLNVAPTLAHQVKVSPDGSVALVAVFASAALIALSMLF